MVVEVERIVLRETVLFIGIHRAGILNDTDVFRRPSRRDVAHNGLLEKWPVSGEADEQGCGLWHMVPRRLVP